jgi:hypothetical protein
MEIHKPASLRNANDPWDARNGLYRVRRNRRQ